jgi:hypothetical protein
VSLLRLLLSPPPLLRITALTDPFISANNTMLTPGFNLTDHQDKEPSYNHPGHSTIFDNRNISDESSPLHAPGLCPATGINAETVRSFDYIDMSRLPPAQHHS